MDGDLKQEVLRKNSVKKIRSRTWNGSEALKRSLPSNSLALSLVYIARLFGRAVLRPTAVSVEPGKEERRPGGDVLLLEADDDRAQAHYRRAIFNGVNGNPN